MVCAAASFYEVLVATTEFNKSEICTLHVIQKQLQLHTHTLYHPFMQLACKQLHIYIHLNLELLTQNCNEHELLMFKYSPKKFTLSTVVNGRSVMKYVVPLLLQFLLQLFLLLLLLLFQDGQK